MQDDGDGSQIIICNGPNERVNLLCTLLKLSTLTTIFTKSNIIYTLFTIYNFY